MPFIRPYDSLGSHQICSIYTFCSPLRLLCMFCMQVDIPPPFSFIPMPMLSATANTALSASISLIIVSCALSFDTKQTAGEERGMSKGNYG